MKRISVLFLIVLTTSFCWSQSVQLKGKVLSKDDVENIHVINKTQSYFTVTDNLGVFSVEVALNDVLQFSSIQYETLEIKIEQSHINNKYIEITLKPIVNALDTVVLGRILTGDLLSDINNTEGEPDINFYNVGIPGYKGKPKTQSERYLYEATSGGGFIPLNPILNGISGRTKKLKNRVAIEANSNCMNKYRILFSEDLFLANPLPKDRIMEFFFYASETETFKRLCDLKNDLKIFQFLTQKLIAFKANLKN